LIDTNVAIDYFKGQSHVRAIIRRPIIIYISAIVLGELYVGAYRSDNEEVKKAEIHELLSNGILLGIDRQVIERYGMLKTQLLNKGRPIPENDIWIAATALRHNLPVYSYDKHFKEIEDLNVFNPLTPI
jgi:tRNA(fMet)-specific endonuclease VapC